LNLGNQYLTWQDLENAEAALDKAAQYLPVSPAVLLSTALSNKLRVGRRSEITTARRCAA
jgi:hypothetical protein